MTSYAYFSQRLIKMDMEYLMENPMKKKKAQDVRDFSSLWGAGVFLVNIGSLRLSIDSSVKNRA